MASDAAAVVVKRELSEVKPGDETAAKQRCLSQFMPELSKVLSLPQLDMTFRMLNILRQQWGL